jgi:hypothetical protein
MSVWLWIVLGMLGFLSASVFVGLFVAAILAKLGHEACGLLEFEELTGRADRDAETVEEPKGATRFGTARLT